MSLSKAGNHLIDEAACLQWEGRQVEKDAVFVKVSNCSLRDLCQLQAKQETSAVLAGTFALLARGP